MTNPISQRSKDAIVLLRRLGSPFRLRTGVTVKVFIECVCCVRHESCASPLIHGL